MIPVERELDRTLTLLRNKIREQGFTQLQVQAELSWGRSYISQLLTKQKSLRVEQVLRILQVIEIEPAEFYQELYRFSDGEGLGQNDPYPSGKEAKAAIAAVDVAQKGGPDAVSAETIQKALHDVVQMLVDRDVLSKEDQVSLNLEKSDDEEPTN